MESLKSEVKEYQFNKFNKSTATQNTYQTKSINSIFKKTQEVEMNEIKERREEKPPHSIEKTFKLHQNVIKMLLKEVENHQKNIKNLQLNNIDLQSQNKILLGKVFPATKLQKNCFRNDENSGRNFLGERQDNEKERKMRLNFSQQPKKNVNEEMEEINILSSLDSKSTEDLFWNPQFTRLTHKTNSFDLIIGKLPQPNLSLNNAFQCEFIHAFSIQMFWGQENTFDLSTIRNINFEIEKTEGNYLILYTGCTLSNFRFIYLP